jgi:hypothetical protein
MNRTRSRWMRLCPALGIFFCLALGGWWPAAGVEMLGFDLSNQMEYSRDTEKDEETFENWLDVNYRMDILTTGLRFEAFQPSKSGQRKEEVSFIYFQVEKDDISLRAGDYYVIFGRGLTLRSYEDRDLRVDNKLTGLKLQGYWDKLEVTLLSGRPPRKDRDNADEIRGIDLQSSSVDGVSVGLSYVSLKAPNTVGKAVGIRSGRFDISRGPLNVYGEYATRTDTSNFDGVYCSSSLSFPGFAVTTEFKDYYQIALRTSDGLEYNNPPALTREHTYSLFRRHPHMLDADDEVGAQVEVHLAPLEQTTFLLNYSYTAAHPESHLLPTETKLFRKWGEPLFREAYAEVSRDLGERVSLVAAGGISRLEEATVHTGVLDLSIYLDDLNTLRGELQGQHTEENGEYDDHMLTVEYTRAPGVSLSFVGERTNKSDLQRLSGEANRWLFVQLDIQLTENHDATLFLGSRQGGYICTGGRCRYEPEFEGVELKLLSYF